MWKKKVLQILLVAGILFSGVLAAYLVACINRADFGIRLWPLMVSVDVFVFSTIGFFMTEDQYEVLYGFCSIASVACAIVQLAILF